MEKRRRVEGQNANVKLSDDRTMTSLLEKSPLKFRNKFTEAANQGELISVIGPSLTSTFSPLSKPNLDVQSIYVETIESE